MEGPAERRPLPDSVLKIAIDDDAIWSDLCDDEQWRPLHAALKRLVLLVRSPRTMQSAALSTGEWNLAHLSVVFELDRLHSLLLARQLSERIQDLAWVEPLSSLVHGLDVAVAAALETGRMLAVEMNAEEPEVAGDYPKEGEGEEVVGFEDIPEWGPGYAYVLYRRYVAEVQTVVDLLAAVCEEAYQGDEEGL